MNIPAWLLPLLIATLSSMMLTGCRTAGTTLPSSDLLRMADGQPVRRAATWKRQRRPEILDFFTREVYGPWPDDRRFRTSYHELEPPTAVRDGRAYRQQIRIAIRNSAGDTLPIDLLIYYPRAARTQPVPTILYLNFLGNHAQVADPEVVLSRADIYTSRPQEHGIVNLRATEAARGDRTRRFPLDSILAQGYAVITAGYQDFMPDNADAYQRRMTDFFQEDPGSTGAISIWAWGYEKLLQYARQQADFQTGELAVIGHSRLGKAALWAAANLEEVDAAFINESGCMGAALSSRAVGETIERINTAFPHWFREAFKAYNGKDRDLPFDQHWLIAAVAPRLVHIGAASEDAWSDPEGMFLALRAAAPAYALVGKPLELPLAFPAPGEAILTGHGAFHLRPGGHDLLAYDWLRYLQFWQLHRSGR